MDESQTKSFTSIKNNKLYKQIAQQIAERINQGDYPPLTRLPPERVIAEQMGVSRPSLREAMIALEVMGLVEIKPGSGIFVTHKPSNPLGFNNNIDDSFGSSVFEILEARIIIEGEVAALAARKSNYALIRKLKAANEQMQEDIEKNIQNITTENDGDYLFHHALVDSIDKQLLKSIVLNLWQEMRYPLFVHTNQALNLTDYAVYAVQDHMKIIEAISQRDVSAARIAMQDHISHVEQFLMREVIAEEEESVHRTA